jgi:hypothetical protein
MTFWNSRDVEPKRSYQWLANVEFQAEETGVVGKIESYAQVSWSPPKFSIELIEHTNLFGVRKTIEAKNYVWEDLEIEFIDISSYDQNGSRIVYDWLTALGYDWKDHKTRGNLLGELTKIHGKNREAANLILEKIGANGDSIESWIFRGAVPQSVTFGSPSNYNNDEISTVKINFKIADVQYEASTADAMKSGLTTLFKKGREQLKKIFK